MIDGLKRAHSMAILDVLRANPRVEKVLLFGSRAMGTFKPESDIDLCLFGKDLTLSDQIRLAAALDELPVPQRVDLLLYHAIEDPAVRAHIEKVGKALLERQTMR